MLCAVGNAMLWLNRMTQNENFLELLECSSTVLVHILACVISRFHSAVNEICALLGSYAVLNGNSVLTLRDELSGPIFKVPAVYEEFFLDCLNFEYGTL